MKRSLLLLLLICGYVQAQEDFETYHSEFSGKDYDIDLAFNDNKYSLYINCISMDRLVDEGGIIVKEGNYDKFMEALDSATSKYKEWTKVAKENKVTSLTKDVKKVKAKCTSFWEYGGNWKFDFSTTLTFDVKISENKAGGVDYWLIMRTGELTASDNQYSNIDGFVMVFSNVEEITEFKQTITPEKINEHKEKDNKKDSLFKD